jgi:uncharacterized protein YndB with AHSA1/START domain
MTNETTRISVYTTVNAAIEDVWKAWTTPESILVWHTASADWHTTKAENDLKKSGFFSYRMEAKSGSFGFDFSGIYDEIIINEYIGYTMSDGRKSSISFNQNELGTDILQTLDTEAENTIELQQNGWQSILNNFKQCVEKKSKKTIKIHDDTNTYTLFL